MKENKSESIQGLTCGCASCKSNEGDRTINNIKGCIVKYFPQLLKILFSAVLFIVAFFLSEEAGLILYILSALIVGYDLIINFFKKLRFFNIFNENSLMLIASATAFVLGESFEGALITLLFFVGEFLEKVATDNSIKRITALSGLRSSVVHLITKDGMSDALPSDVKVGSLIEVKSGEIVPIDGVLIGLCCEFDFKAITGESKLVVVKNGEEVLSGAINVGNPVVIRTTKNYKDSTVENIASMVEGALSKKAKSQKFISTFAKFYTPVVFGLALFISVIPPLIDNMDFVKWIYKALSFLVISCPCALVLSVPLGYFVGIGGLAKRGVLVKGSKYLDTLTRVDAVVFDKTGTLTYGDFTLERVECFNGYSKEYIFDICVSLEQFSNHPISKAFDLSKINQKFVSSEVKEIPGKGLVGVIDGKNISLGNHAIMENEKIDIYEEYAGTILYLVINRELAGKIYIMDRVKENAKQAIDNLKKIGVKQTVILSGDNTITANAVGEKLSIDCVYSGLLPTDKLEMLKKIKSSNQNNIVYVGDGINDSPALALADVGVAMGGLGSEIAKSTADIVIMDDNLEKIATTIAHSRKVKRTVMQNIFGSLFVKLSIMLLSLIIVMPVWIAMLADVGVMLLAVCNSLKVSKVQSKTPR